MSLTFSHPDPFSVTEDFFMNGEIGNFCWPKVVTKMVPVFRISSLVPYVSWHEASKREDAHFTIHFPYDASVRQVAEQSRIEGLGSK